MGILAYMKGHRTQMIARVIMVLGLMQQYGADMFPKEHMGVIMFLIALAMEGMRWITTTPPRKNA